MLINPNVAIKENWISGIKNPTRQVQPNAIDFSLDDIYCIRADTITVSENNKQFRVTSPARVTIENGDPVWVLHQGMSYDCMSEVFVKIPQGVAAYLIMRSTFTRNGLFIHSGLYDSGFEGHVGFVIHNPAGITKIGVGTRVGQIVFVESDSAKLYEGGFNHKQGSYWKAGVENE